MTTVSASETAISAVPIATMVSSRGPRRHDRDVPPRHRPARGATVVTGSAEDAWPVPGRNSLTRPTNGRPGPEAIPGKVLTVTALVAALVFG
jgi:hypothetical protein